MSSATFDPVLLIVIGAAFVLTSILQEWKNIPFLLGMTLYFLYIIKIGGDFMAGRFLTGPFLIAVILLVRNTYPSLKWAWVALLAGIVLIGFLTPNSRWYTIIKSNVLSDAQGVADERAFYVDSTGIFNVLLNMQIPNGPYAQDKLKAEQNNQKVVVVLNRIGFFGFDVGPHVHIVDLPALADPLLARLPSQGHWRIGHFHRTIPAGYIQTLQTGINVIQNKDLALYYDKLHYITSGPLFDFNRLIEIWKFNTGAYNYLLHAYVEHPGTSMDMSRAVCVKIELEGDLKGTPLQ